jgi:hypothetical protein
MFLVGSDGIADFDLDLLSDVLAPLDKHLELICREFFEVPDPDASGHFERAEYVTGLGFVACQAYLTSTYSFLGVQKVKAIMIGPVHRSGRTAVSIINHAANYWKHRDEWILDSSDTKRKRIAEVFEDVGFPVDTDYPLSGILTELVTPSAAAFAPLLLVLESWRDDLYKSVV